MTVPSGIHMGIASSHHSVPSQNCLIIQHQLATYKLRHKLSEGCCEVSIVRSLTLEFLSHVLNCQSRQQQHKVEMQEVIVCSLAGWFRLYHKPELSLEGHKNLL